MGPFSFFMEGIKSNIFMLPSKEGEKDIFVEFIYWLNLKVGRNASGVLELILEKKRSVVENNDEIHRKDLEFFVNNLILQNPELRTFKEDLVERMCIYLSGELSSSRKSEIEEYNILGYGFIPNTIFKHITSVSTFYSILKHLKHLNFGILKEYSYDNKSGLWIPTKDDKPDESVRTIYSEKVVQSLDYLRSSGFFEDPKALIERQGEGTYFPSSSLVMAATILKNYIVSIVKE